MGRSDIDLDDEGRRQVTRLGASAGGAFAAVCSSPSRRALDTARALVPPEPEIDDGLREVDHGELEGLVYPEALTRWPDFFRAWADDPGLTRCPGGETLGEARDRAMAALVRRARTGAPGVVAVVTHQLVAAAVWCTLEGRPLSAWREFRLGHVHGVPLAWRDGRLAVAGPVLSLAGGAAAGV